MLGIRFVTVLVIFIVKMKVFFAFENIERTISQAKKTASMYPAKTPEIMNPILGPIAKIIDSFEPRSQIMRDDGGGTERVLRALRLLPDSTTTTTPASAIEQVFDPLFDSIRKELRKVSLSNALSTRPVSPQMSFSKDQAAANLSKNGREIGKVSHTASPTLPRLSKEDVMAINKFTGPLKSLLETIGMNAPPKDEFQLGKDESISILGMPIGRKDGLTISPTTGLSYGPSYSIGPLAINDRYNLKWDFLDKIGNLLFS